MQTTIKNRTIKVIIPDFGRISVVLLSSTGKSIKQSITGFAFYPCYTSLLFNMLDFFLKKVDFFVSQNGTF